MIPILYDSSETSFVSNGIGRLAEALSCSVTEERNGIYELEMAYPISGKWFSQMQIGCYIAAIHDDAHDVQPFQIYKISAPLNGIVTFYAHHLSYQLSGIILQPFSAVSISDLFNQIPAQSVNANPFTFWTDKSVATAYNLTVPSAVRQILGGSQGSILDVYGKGEYKFDKYSVKLYTNRGSDTGVTIRYGKNLTALKKDLDGSQTYGAVAPYWVGDGGTVYLPEVIVTSQPGLPATPLDLSDDFDQMPTEAELRTRAEAYLADNEPWIPDENISIDFIQLWQTSEYDDLAVLQRVSLCDKVTVIYSALGVVAQNQEVIKVVYDSLGEYYTKMELGKLQTNLYESISEAAKQDIVTVTPGALEAAIDKATQLITGGLGGYVMFTHNENGEPQEILVMDSDNAMTAMSVIRINKNGIGFSRTGINGPYSTAWTIDGSFNADYITAGAINGSLITAGTIASQDGTTFVLDLEDGELKMNVSSLQLNNKDMSVVIQDQINPLAEDVGDLRAHIAIASDGSMTFIGADNNPITLRLVNDSLQIYNGGKAIDTFGSGGTITENLTVTAGGSLNLLPYKFIARTNGHLQLVYVG